MTANELLALLGRAWSRLLLYPGGLAAFTLVWLIDRTKNREPRTASQRIGSRFSVGYPLGGSPLEISAIVLPWLGLALLPLPYVAGISRQTDAIAVLALLEWPLVLTIAAELRAADAGARVHGVRRMAAALNGYPPLILATLVLALGVGSADLAALARPPDDAAPSSAMLLHWLGAAACTLALPPVLAIGAFAANLPEECALRTGLRLRALGLVAIAALPWFPLAVSLGGGDQEGILSWVGLPAPPLLIAALLWGYNRLTARHGARGWARGYLVVDIALLLVLLWAAYQALQARLA